MDNYFLLQALHSCLINLIILEFEYEDLYNLLKANVIDENLIDYKYIFYQLDARMDGQIIYVNNGEFKYCTDDSDDVLENGTFDTTYNKIENIVNDINFQDVRHIQKILLIRQKYISTNY